MELLVFPNEHAIALGMHHASRSRIRILTQLNQEQSTHESRQIKDRHLQLKECHSNPINIDRPVSIVNTKRLTHKIAEYYGYN